MQIIIFISKYSHWVGILLISKSMPISGHQPADPTISANLRLRGKESLPGWLTFFPLLALCTLLWIS